MRMYKAPCELELSLKKDSLLIFEPNSDEIFIFNNEFKLAFNDLNTKCIVWFTNNGVEFYLFDKKLVLLKILNNEYGTEIVVGVKKGTNIYHGIINYNNKYYDSNGDNIPDVIDHVIEICKYRKLIL